MQILNPSVGLQTNIHYNNYSKENLMLKLKNIVSKTRNIYNESDCYVKISISVEEIEISDGVCYWSVINTDGSLAELTLLNPSGAIRDIIVPLFHTIHYESINALINNTNIVQKEGFPLFETQLSEYQSTYYHLPAENINFKIYADNSSVTIVFSFNTIALHVINKPITFGFDIDNNLCYIQIKNMRFNEAGFLEILKHG